MEPKIKKQLERISEEITNAEFAIQILEQEAGEFGHLYIPLLKDLQRQHRKTIECVKQGKPFVASYYTNAPEIYTAMDVHWICILAQSFGGVGENPHLMEDLEAVDGMAVPNDVCTMLRLALYHMDAGLLPRPTAFVALLEPCDGVTGLHEVIGNHQEWGDIPMFAPDAPYFKDERSISYFADELRRMVSFLEEHTGQKLDMVRLHQVVEESNKQYALWADYTELRRAVPCPHGWTLARACFAAVQNEGAGRPERTDWFRDLVADAEKRVGEKRGEVPNQKIRVLWFDITPIWFPKLTSWMEQEWGAVVITEMFGYAPYTLIDTSSEETMFHDLAKRNLLDVPMIRQARGLADNFIYDLDRMVKDYNIDVVIVPGHMGHKDGAASISLMREKCRDLRVPLLHIGVDQFDERYTTVDQMKEKISHFFTAMGLG